jgi:hypothetical protein
MHIMMNERLTELALKTIAGQATNAERDELDLALNRDHSLREEFEQLRASASVAREVLPVAAALEAAEGEFPAYARERLQTKVRQTFGCPAVSKTKPPWAWKLFLVLAPVTAAVVIFLAVGSAPKPIVQVAMLDTVGQVRGQAPRDMSLIEGQWEGAKVQVFSNAQELASWEKKWPGTKAPVAKVIFDPAAAEVRALVRSGDNETQKIIPVEGDLRTALREAETFIAEQTKRNYGK